jgi:hypothetical protein
MIKENKGMGEMTKDDGTESVDSSVWNVWNDPEPGKAVGVRAEDGGICTYCGEYYEQLGMTINWTERVVDGVSEGEKTRQICVKCLIKAFDNALGRKP